jgi:hypothetical protein
MKYRTLASMVGRMDGTHISTCAGGCDCRWEFAKGTLFCQGNVRQGFVNACNWLALWRFATRSPLMIETGCGEGGTKRTVVNWRSRLLSSNSQKLAIQRSIRRTCLIPTCECWMDTEETYRNHPRSAPWARWLWDSCIRRVMCNAMAARSPVQHPPQL